jgi:hypothetical protein
MENFLTTVIALTSFMTFVMNFFCLTEIRKMKCQFEILERNFPEFQEWLLENFSDIDDKVVELSNQLDRKMSPSNSSDASTPIIPKKNNWDSIRTIFGGTSRVINERD